MGYPIDQKMVVCVTSSALFDMTESDKIFREEGVKAYKEYQESNVDNTLDKGVAYPFCKKVVVIE